MKVCVITDNLYIYEHFVDLLRRKPQAAEFDFFYATWNHAFRNSLVPIANTIIPLITGIMGGSLVIEKIFAVPGEGGLLVDSILAGDHFLTVALLIFYSLISLITIFVVDVSYGIIDPRIRIGGGK